MARFPQKKLSGIQKKNLMNIITKNKDNVSFVKMTNRSSLQQNSTESQNYKFTNRSCAMNIDTQESVDPLSNRFKEGIKPFAPQPVSKIDETHKSSANRKIKAGTKSGNKKTQFKPLAPK